MNTRKAGRRHRLLLYQRLMDRLWGVTLIMGLLLAAVWWWNGYLISAAIHAPYDTLLALAAVFVLIFAALAFLGRSMAYVQARRDHLRVVTPFLQLKISYRRLRTVHPADFHNLFPPSQAKWAEHQFFEPFYGKTALVVELNGFPMSRKALRFFLPKQMFDPQLNGLVLVVKDWMALSTEIDSSHSAWRQAQSPRPGTSQPSPHGLLGTLKKK